MYCRNWFHFLNKMRILQKYNSLLWNFALEIISSCMFLINVPYFSVQLTFHSYPCLLQERKSNLKIPMQTVIKHIIQFSELFYVPKNRRSSSSSQIKNSKLTCHFHENFNWKSANDPQTEPKLILPGSLVSRRERKIWLDQGPTRLHRQSVGGASKTRGPRVCTIINDRG